MNVLLRESFWNIPEALKISFYLLALFAILIFAYGIYLHIKFWNSGRGKLKPNWKKGTLNFIKYSFLQIRLLYEKFGGIMHLLIYTGFLILFLGTSTLTIQERITEPFFQNHFLKGAWFLMFEFTLDLFALFFITGILTAIIRRYFIKPKRLNYDIDFQIVIWLLFLIGITGILVESFRILGAKTPYASFSFMGYIFSLPFKNLSLEMVKKLHLSLWIIHAILSLGFIAYIPFCSLSHIIFSPVNHFFQDTEKNYIQKIDFEKEEFFGVQKLKDFEKREILGIDACIKCGRCYDVCPAVSAGTELSPKNVIVKLKELYLKKDVDVIDGIVESDEILPCTTCLHCVKVCPVLVPILDIIIGLRRYLSLSLGILPKTASETLKNIERYGNPFGITEEKFSKFKNTIKFAEEGKEYDFILWIGCLGSFEQRNQEVVKNLLNILNKLNINYGVLKEEKCTGDSARRLGNEYLFQMLAEENINNLRKYRFEKILTFCPHCYQLFKKEYREFGADFEVVHHTQFLKDLIDSGKINLKNKNIYFTYHDPCYLGRYNGIFDIPREIIKKMGKIREPDRKKENSFCCGGGGGGMWLEVPSNAKINEIRFSELSKSAENIVTACPYCLMMFDLAQKVIGNENINLKDISEYVNEFSI